jgi:hypothetical protein
VVPVASMVTPRLTLLHAAGHRVGRDIVDMRVDPPLVAEGINKDCASVAGELILRPAKPGGLGLEGAPVHLVGNTHIRVSRLARH